MTNQEINHEYTREIVCPWCGHEFQDSWEYPDDGKGDGCIGILGCGECGKSFDAVRDYEITYITNKVPYGTCKHCKAENVVLFSRKYLTKDYEDLCRQCTNKEEDRQKREYEQQLEDLKVCKCQACSAERENK